MLIALILKVFVFLVLIWHRSGMLIELPNRLQEALHNFSNPVLRNVK